MHAYRGLAGQVNNGGCEDKIVCVGVFRTHITWRFVPAMPLVRIIDKSFFVCAIVARVLSMVRFRLNQSTSRGGADQAALVLAPVPFLQQMQAHLCISTSFLLLQRRVSKFFSMR